MGENLPASYRQNLNLSIGVMIGSHIIPRIILETGPVLVRLIITFLFGLIYVGAGTYLFGRFWRGQRIWGEKSKASIALLLIPIFSVFCLLPYVFGDYAGPQNVAHRAYMQVLNMHIEFTIFGGLWLGILGIVLLFVSIKEA
jgi:hypothetical protein